MPNARFIQLPKVPQTYDERSMRNLMQAVRHNLQQIIDNGIGSTQFRSLYLDAVRNIGPPPVTGQPTDSQPPEDAPRGIPGVVSNLTATAAYSSILLDWVAPLGTDWTHFEVWRLDAANVSQAFLLDTTTVEGYADVPPATQTTYYYWVRAVNVDMAGPYAGPVSAMLVPDFDEIYTGIQNSIFTDPLFTNLSGRVDLIQAGDDVIGSINWHVLQESLARAQALLDEAQARADAIAIETQNRINAINALDAEIQLDIDAINLQLADLESVQVFDQNVAYKVGDLVTYEGGLYRCIQATIVPSPLPTNESYWQYIGAYASLGEAVAAHASMIDINISDIAAEVIRTDQLYADVYNETTGLSSRATIDYVDQAQADIYGASVSQFTAINAALYDPVTGLDVTKASITQLNSAKAEIYSAEVTSFTQIQAALYDPITGIANTKADITYVDQIELDIYGAAVTSFTQIDAALYDPITGLEATKATITYVDQTEADIYSAAVSSFTNINAALYDPVTGLANTKASITQLNEAKTEIYSAAVSAFTQIDAALYHPDTGLANTRATITYVDDTKADIFGAAVSSFTAINAALYDPVTGLEATKATITYVDQTEADIYSAAVTSFTAINAALYDPITGLANTKASITYVDQTEADIYSAAVSSFTNINAALYDPITGLEATKAGITYVDTSVADAESNAVATATQQVYTTLGGDQAAVQTKAESWDGTAAQWTLKTSVGDLVGGIGLLNDGVMTRLYVQADRFAVYGSAVPGDPTLGIPFVVEGGVTYIKDAAIKDAAIKTAKIDDLAVTTAKIGNLQVTTAKIGGLQVTDAKIASLAVSKLEAGTINAQITMTNNLILSTAGKLYTAGKTTVTSTSPGVWMGHITGSHYGLSVGDATKYLRYRSDTGVLETNAGRISNGLADNTLLTPSSARLHTGGGRQAPFQIIDAARGALPVSVPTFTSPANGTGWNQRRFGFQNQEILIKAFITGTNSGETPLSGNILFRVDTGGGFTNFRTDTWNLPTGTHNRYYVMRYTTPNTWNTLQVQASANHANFATVFVATLDVFIDNTKQAASTAGSSSDPNNSSAGVGSNVVTPPNWAIP